MDLGWLAGLGGAGLVVGGLLFFWRSRQRQVDRPEVERRDTPAPSGTDRWRTALGKTRARFAAQLEAALGGRGNEAFDSLEEVLLAADVGAATATRVIEGVRSRVGRGASVGAIRTALQEELVGALGGGEVRPPVPTETPWVVLVVGVNGVGKTTTIGKLSAWHRRQGRQVLLVAADTFRAAAIDQLEVWASRTGAEIVHHAAGGDPSAVVYDGLKAARARGVDVVLIDSAGRLHTKTNLMAELAKLRRVLGREVSGAPHEVLLVLDATTGQNALAQARVFAGQIGITGVVITKLDGTAKGGVAFAVQEQLGAPILYVGVGESIDDLTPFDPAAFVEALLAPNG